MDTTTHAVIPLEHLRELEEAAYDKSPTSNAERAGAAASTVVFFGAASGAFVAASWGYVKAVNWLEKKQLERRTRKQGTVTNITSAK